MGDRSSRYLADACALVGFYRSAPKFPAGLRVLIENDTGKVAVAAATVWEIAIKTARGKLAEISAPKYPILTHMLATQGFTLLPPDAATAEHAANLPPLHADPFDRALVALRSALAGPSSPPMPPSRATACRSCGSQGGRLASAMASLFKPPAGPVHQH